MFPQKNKISHIAFLKAAAGRFFRKILSLLQKILPATVAASAPPITNDTTRIQQALKEKVNFTDLPDDTIGCIGRFLSPIDLFHLSATSREMKIIVENNVDTHFKHYCLLRKNLLKRGLKREVLRGLFQRTDISPDSLSEIFKILRHLTQDFINTIDTPFEALFLAGEINLITQAEMDLIRQKNFDCPLSIISLTGNVKKMILAKEKWGLDEHAVTEDNISVLHHAALSGSVEAMEYAKQVWQLDKDAVTDHGITLLHCAALSGSPEAIACAAAWGLDERALNNDRATIVHLAARGGSVPTLQYLCTHWDWHRIHLTDTDASNKTALHYAAAGGSRSTFRWLLQQGVPVTLNDDQKTPFDFAPDKTTREELEKIHDEFLLWSALPFTSSAT